MFLYLRREIMMSPGLEGIYMWSKLDFLLMYIHIRFNNVHVHNTTEK